jgi:excisionase family DNA binding protein
MNANSRYLKVGEVAEALGMHETTIYKMCQNGEIPSIKIGAKAVRIPKAAFEAFMARQNGDPAVHQGRDLLDAVFAGATDPLPALEHQAKLFTERVGSSAHQFVEQWRDRKVEDTAETMDTVIEALTLQKALDAAGIGDRVLA